MPERIRWGILSTANIARKAFIPGVMASNNGTVAAIASRDIHKAQRSASELAIPRAYGSYEELLADRELDAIYIGLPNTLHAEWTKKCAEAGKPVLCEKPLAVDAAQAQDVVDFCAQRDVPLMEAFMYRFHPQHARVRELLDAGAIGELRAVRAAFTFSLEPFDARNVRLRSDLAGGALMDVGCYCVNAARMLFGEEPQWASAQWDFREEYGVEIALAGVLGFSDGRMASLDCGLRGWGQGRYEVVGTEGAIEALNAFTPRASKTVELLVTREGERSSERIPGLDQYRMEAQAFADAVLESRPPPAPPSDVIANMRAIDALRSSALHQGIRQPV